MTRFSTLVLLLGLASCGGNPAPASVVASNTAAAISEPSAPARGLAGIYLAKHPTMVMCEDGRGVECEEEGEDRLVIRESGRGRLAIELETLGTNYHTCAFDETLELFEDVAGVQLYHYIAPPSSDDGDCELTLEVTAQQLAVTADGCSYYCGMRATLDSTFSRP